MKKLCFIQSKPTLQTPAYYGQFALFLGKETPIHFLYIQPT